jgi:hypothetical protein
VESSAPSDVGDWRVVLEMMGSEIMKLVDWYDGEYPDILIYAGWCQDVMFLRRSQNRYVLSVFFFVKFVK